MVHTEGTLDPGVDEAGAEWATSVLAADPQGPIIGPENCWSRASQKSPWRLLIAGMGCVFLISLPHRASWLKATVGRQETELRMLNGWRTAISLFHSKREVPRNRYVDPNRLIPLDVTLTKGDFSHWGCVGGTNLQTVGQIEVT